MPATIIMGGMWGDEGKGKLTDALASNADIVVRANGGSNAGHTVETDLGVFKLHLVPSGILHPGVICAIGAGVVIEPRTLITELDNLIARGIDVSNLRISDRAHIVMPWHPLIDKLEEQRREGEEIGTTLRGNGPAYADKVSRHGLRMADMRRLDGLRRKLAIELDARNQILQGVYGQEPLDFNRIYRDFVEYADRLVPYLTPTEVLVQDALENDRRVLVECAQAALLDIDYGTYPYVTSSSPTAAGACQGAGVAPTQVEKIIGVYKAYTTRVGAGPMPAELKDETGELIRGRGNEYGTTTGRPRRTGWYDAVAARHTRRLNGVTDIALTLLDVLDPFPEISLCTAYEGPEGEFTHLPALIEDLEGVEPVWARIAGWQEDITRVRSYDELPAQARAYLATIESLTGAPITFIGVGPARDALIDRRLAEARSGRTC
jgi:adenylosuccinate synthase